MSIYCKNSDNICLRFRICPPSEDELVYLFASLNEFNSFVITVIVQNNKYRRYVILNCALVMINTKYTFIFL